jgi:hypothetical protein
MSDAALVLTGVGAGVCALATWLRMGPRHAPAAAAATAGATTAAAGPLNAMLGLGAAAMLLGAVLRLHPRGKPPAKVRRRRPLRRGPTGEHVVPPQVPRSPAAHNTHAASGSVCV